MPRTSVQGLQENRNGEIDFHSSPRELAGVYKACHPLEQEARPHVYRKCDRRKDVPNGIEDGLERQGGVFRETRSRFYGGFRRRGAKLPSRQGRCAVCLANLLLFGDSRVGFVTGV